MSRIPIGIATLPLLTDGVVVNIDTHYDALVIRRDNATLEERLGNVHPDQLHEEISFEEGTAIRGCCAIPAGAR